jgi:hypothetical protein
MLVSVAAAPELGVADNCTMNRSYCTAAAGRCRPALAVLNALAPAQVGQKTGRTRWGSTGLGLACMRKQPGTGCHHS